MMSFVPGPSSHTVDISQLSYEPSLHRGTLASSSPGDEQGSGGEGGSLINAEPTEDAAKQRSTQGTRHGPGSSPATPHATTRHTNNDEHIYSDTEDPDRLSFEEGEKDNIVVRPLEATSNSSYPTKPPKPRTFGRGWSLDILSLLGSITAIIAIYIILACYDRHPSPLWPHNITINNIVSIFATILKALMLLVIADGQPHGSTRHKAHAD